MLKKSQLKTNRGLAVFIFLKSEIVIWEDPHQIKLYKILEFRKQRMFQ